MLNGNGNGHASLDEEEKSHSHPRGFFADQFEVSLSHSGCVGTDPELVLQNRSNFDAHFTGTGPEIWRQTNGEIIGFVAGAGQSNIVLSLAAV